MGYYFRIVSMTETAQTGVEINKGDIFLIDSEGRYLGFSNISGHAGVLDGDKWIYTNKSDLFRLGERVTVDSDSVTLISPCCGGTSTELDGYVVETSYHGYRFVSKEQLLECEKTI